MNATHIFRHFRRVIPDTPDNGHISTGNKILKPGRLALPSDHRGFMRPCMAPAQPFAGLPVTPNHIHPQQIIQPSAVNPHRHHISTTQDIVQADTTALLFPEISPRPAVRAQGKTNFHIGVF